MLQGRCLLFAFGLVVSGAGCATVSTFHTARPVETGRTEVIFAGTALADQDGIVDTVLPSFRLRRGLHPRLDLGLNAIFARTEITDENRPVLALGGAVDLNFMFLDLGLVTASVDPLVRGSYSPADGTFLGDVELNLLVDLISTPVFSLTAGLRPGVQLTLENTQVGVTSARRYVTSALVAARLSFLGLALMPEVDVLFDAQGGAPTYAAGLALAF